MWSAKSNDPPPVTEDKDNESKDQNPFMIGVDEGRSSKIKLQLTSFHKKKALLIGVSDYGDLRTHRNE